MKLHQMVSMNTTSINSSKIPCMCANLYAEPSSRQFPVLHPSKAFALFFRGDLMEYVQGLGFWMLECNVSTFLSA